MSRLLLNISTLHRSIHKYLDRKLKDFNLGSGQFFFLLEINENEGISMNELTSSGNFDKGTITKTIQKLEEEDYIKIIVDQNDRRKKQLYTTNKASVIMQELYVLRKNCNDNLLFGLNNQRILDDITVMTNNSNTFLELPNRKLRIGGMQKISLVDYPNELASTIFLSGCNLKCPFCHNKDLVFVDANASFIESSEVMDYLIKRQNKLKAVCISGGEPLMQDEVIDFIKEIKEQGYKIKLDTNGFYPDKLKLVIDEKLVDYIAMDIKNSLDKYAKTIGLEVNETIEKNIKESIDLIMKSDIDYEFRTTVVKELHTKENIENISILIKGSRKYCLQYFRNNENVINNELNSIDEETMTEFYNIAIKYIENVEIRGEGECIK